MPTLIPVKYEDLAPDAMVQIFKAADDLNMPPHDIAVLYLTQRARAAVTPEPQPQPEPCLG